MPITINGTGTIAGISVGGLENGCVNEADLATAAVTNTKLASTAVTIDKLGTTEQSQLCKAWVNFNGTANSNISGTYSQSGTAITVTATNHGLTAGQQVFLTFSTGTATAELCTVASVTSSSVFVATSATSRTTSGNCTLNFQTIRASFNVSSITDNGTGDYTMNFTNALADANYSALGSVIGTTGAAFEFNSFIGSSNIGLNAGSCRFATKRDDGVSLDCSVISIAIFR